jgi:hypothetical protein
VQPVLARDLFALLRKATDAFQRRLTIQTLITAGGILETIRDRFSVLTQSFQFTKPNLRLTGTRSNSAGIDTRDELQEQRIGIRFSVRDEIFLLCTVYK